ncbi:MAG: patatin-like phospholipase family protein [Spirochaetes bacterium]|nr:patatin-like phospholipase family protein [Spirochaetota bacterium]
MRSLKFNIRNFFRKYIIRKQKIGLALGSGGAKGISHIGVLEVLEKNQLVPDEISGCSIGAIIGALYASGVSLRTIKQIALKINFISSIELFDLTFPKDGGIVKGHIVEDFLNSILPVKRFEELKIPFTCVATDLIKGKQVVFKKGELIPAIRASISIPGFFIPYQYNDDLLIDGSVLNPVPVDLLTDSDYRIAVVLDEYTLLKEILKKKVYFETKINKLLKESIFPKLRSLPIGKSKRIHKKAGTIDILSATFDLINQELLHFDLNELEADLIIKPDVKSIPTLAFYMGRKSYREGVKAAKSVVSLIKNKITK